MFFDEKGMKLYQKNNLDSHILLKDCCMACKWKMLTNWSANER